MTHQALWTDPLYQETILVIVGFLTFVGLLLFAIRNTSPHLTAAWASVKSWFFIAPLILIAMALPSPWPLVFLTLIAVFSTKVFFQMVGMYHRSWFIWTSYVFILASGYLIHSHQTGVYNILPMIFLGCIACIPLLRNSATHMIQYMALALMAFIFFGWSFMHLGRILVLDQGVFILIYLYVLTEISENVSLAWSRLFGKVKLFSKISSRITLEGVIASILVSLLIAWALRHLLPDRSEQFWIAAGLVAALFGRLGDLILSVIRRDLGIKNTGVFIIGRGDILGRVDKLIFVGPMYYYIYIYLQQHNLF